MQFSLIILTTILLGWGVLTLYVEKQGPSKLWHLGNKAGKKILILYDADPFYNLDEQVCLSLGKAFADKGMRATIITVAAASRVEETYDLYVYCANTYNWMPDWAVTNYIKKQSSIKGRPVVALTLGAGSTEHSQKVLEKLIIDQGGILLASHPLWLLRPNDESKMDKSNVGVAVDIAYQWGVQIADQLNQSSQ